MSVILLTLAIVALLIRGIFDRVVIPRIEKRLKEIGADPISEEQKIEKQQAEEVLRSYKWLEHLLFWSCVILLFFAVVFLVIDYQFTFGHHGS
jgi:hypothetical protein